MDEYNKFYGPGCHWTQGKQACEKDFMTTELGQPEFGQPEYQNSVEEKYMREPSAFYKELNVAYVEEKKAQIHNGMRSSDTSPLSFGECGHTWFVSIIPSTVIFRNVHRSSPKSTFSSIAMAE